MGAIRMANTRSSSNSFGVDGFGGHTPLFNAVVCGPREETLMTRTLLARGGDPAVRASLRKFLDWCESPRWHEARDVTPLEWARGFPEQGWVNHEAVGRLPCAEPPHGQRETKKGGAS